MIVDERGIQFVKVGNLDELAQKSFLKVKLLGKVVGIFPGDNGAPYGIEMTCKHQGADLTAGAFAGDLVTCSRHGWTYNFKSGQCVNHDSLPLRRHLVKIEDGSLYVSLTAATAPAAWDASNESR